jgi:hypothetical protein
MALMLSALSMVVPTWAAYRRRDSPLAVVVMVGNLGWSMGVHSPYGCSDVHRWYHTVDYVLIATWVAYAATFLRSSAHPGFYIYSLAGVAALNGARLLHPHGSLPRTCLHVCMHLTGSAAMSLSMFLEPHRK